MRTDVLGRGLGVVGMETPVARQLKSQIRQFGAVDMGAFMAACIAPYYASRDPFGVSGDFVTAPEISQTFGEMLGVCLMDAWTRAGKPAAHLVEIGGGRGTLMADILRIAKIAGFKGDVHMVENSPHLRARQQYTLQGYAPQFHDDISTLPHDGPLLIVANEFLDALPVRQAVYQDGWLERVVGLDDAGDLALGVRALPVPYAPDFTAKNGSVYEFSPARDSVVLGLAQRIMTQGGLFLTLDYGYNHPTPTGDTIQALYKHEFCPIFDYMGDADLTAHVDFKRVGDIAKGVGCKVYGSVPQGDLLRGLGIEARAIQLAKAGSDTVQNDVMRLIDPQGMGGLFLAMAFGDGRFIPAFS